MNMYDDKIERIICAAICYKNWPNIDPHRPININGNAIVITGMRHHNVISIFKSLTGQCTNSSNPHIMGFLTTNNRFVNRKEAAEIAYKAGQIKDPTNDWLMSEDLY